MFFTPYAKTIPPPECISHETFQDPIEKTSWAPNVLDATSNSTKSCPQSPYKPHEQSEDCLTLNVLTPKVSQIDRSKYPVMVWIHGGAFIKGSSAAFVRRTAVRNIINRQVVLVVLHYRLGPFGRVLDIQQ